MGNVGKDVSTCSPYGGYSGNVLFSRSPLTQPTTRSLALAPGLFNSDAIFATSSFSGVGNVQLYVTHPPGGFAPFHRIRVVFVLSSSCAALSREEDF
jgi:hypothetical protein